MSASPKPPSLVLLPGLAGDARMWADVHSQLDLPLAVTVSQTHSHADDTSISAMARRLLAETDGPLLLCGASMGGMVAMEAVHLAPERIAGLVLCCTNARAETPEMRALRTDAIALFEAGDFADLIRANVEFAFHPDSLRRPGLVQRYVDFVLDAGGAQLARQNLAVTMRPDARVHLPQCACPVLVLCGDSDQLTPPEHSQEIADLIAQAELHWIARCGHMLTMEHPAVVSQHIKRWLLQHGFI